MVPVAVAVMGRVAVRSRSAGAVFLAGVVAASFKLLDLFVPGTDVLALSRPIQAILLEALAGAVWMKLAKMGTFTFFEQDQRRAAIPVRGQSLDRRTGLRSSDDRPAMTDARLKKKLETASA